MRPSIVLALAAFLLSLQGLIPWLFLGSKAVPLLSIFLVFLSFYLFRKNKAAFKTFRALMWVIFILSLVIGLMLFFGMSAQLTFLKHLILKKSVGLTVLYFTGWLCVIGGLLYYMETGKVRMEYSLPPKKTTGQSQDGIS